MTAEIKIVNMYTKVIDLGGTVINTTSKSGWSSDLSPFSVGPNHLYGDEHSLNVENAWQYAKVYEKHADKNGDPTEEYWAWAREGWADPKPHRYPMGRGARPLYSHWNGERLGYIDARKQIYAPLFAEAVQRTEGWQTLKELYNTSHLLILRDYDGYDYVKKDMTLSEVLNYSRKKMGHAFVLAMLLLNDEEALNQCAMRKRPEDA